MGSLFEHAFANSSTKEKIRLIVLVTMVSLLLELVHDPLARIGLPGVFLLQEFHAAGLLPGSRRGLRGRGTSSPARPALVLPMLALFVGVITLLRYDTGAANDFFAASPMHEQTVCRRRWTA